MKLRLYQQNILNCVLDHLKENKRCCVALSTGGGKTVIFSELVKLLTGKTLICVHREELVNQTSNTLSLPHDKLIPATKFIDKDICVAMVQTLHNRMKKGKIDITTFDNIIIDEAHRGDFMKILKNYEGNAIGFTATPNYEKTRIFYKCLVCGSEYDDNEKKCCKRKTQKYKENIPLSDFYGKLITGPSIKDLIKEGFLVQDENFVLDIDTTKLVYDQMRGDYTEESIGLVFGSDQAIRNTIDVYKSLALNKKTIIFNPNTLVNKRLYNSMLHEGLPVKMYDSKNSDEDREELVKWFKETPNATLLNVHVFTTGFDCKEVEVIFLNKKTKSINLFIQMVGRGGRPSEEIFKPTFRVIDMGNNYEDFGNWSDERDWSEYFYTKEKKPVGLPKPAAVRTCHNCEAIIAANSLECEHCGSERVYDEGGVVGLPQRNGKFVMPSPNNIIEYCERKDLDCLEARKIVYESFAKLFDKTPHEVYCKHLCSGYLYQKAKKHLFEYYWAIQKSKLKGNRVRTLASFTNESIKAVERRYITSEVV
jgi:superfamily II DNA or RNA helicase